MYNLLQDNAYIYIYTNAYLLYKLDARPVPKTSSVLNRKKIFGAGKIIYCAIVKFGINRALRLRALYPKRPTQIVVLRQRIATYFKK